MLFAMPHGLVLHAVSMIRYERDGWVTLVAACGRRRCDALDEDLGDLPRGLPAGESLCRGCAASLRSVLR